ncbi:MAG: hypothetical protein CMO19_03395 [Thaumarchaeota archaeon]|nr:hypothetical protein [Nitrososphaerota archaeon]|tara:strand:- start:5592 stop:6044 length:453 start_codon:yes stop_codon:yes gene_type:complete
MIDSILDRCNILLNKLNKKNFSVILFVIIAIFIFSLRANAINLSTEYTSGLESNIRSIPPDQLYNSSFVQQVPVSIFTVEGNGKSIDVKYVTLINLISGTHSIDLSDYDSFSSIETKNYYLPGDYTVYVTIEDDVLILEYERFLGRLGKV